MTKLLSLCDLKNFKNRSYDFILGNTANCGNLRILLGINTFLYPCIASTENYRTNEIVIFIALKMASEDFYQRTAKILCPKLSKNLQICNSNKTLQSLLSGVAELKKLLFSICIWLTV